MRDELYITQDQWEEFVGVPNNQRPNPDRFTHVTAAAIAHILLTPTLFWSERDITAALAEVMLLVGFTIPFSFISEPFLATTKTTVPVI